MIAVLMGGYSAEREISLLSGNGAVMRYINPSLIVMSIASHLI